MIGLSGLRDIKQVCDTVIKPSGAEGLSTFWGYYVLLTLAELGETEFALDIIREYWGAMLAWRCRKRQYMFGITMCNL